MQEEEGRGCPHMYEEIYIESHINFVKSPN